MRFLCLRVSLSGEVYKNLHLVEEDVVLFFLVAYIKLP